MAALERIGIRNVGMHSLRIGGATSLAMLGVSPEVIRVIGRWKSLCYQLYVRVSTATLKATAHTLAKASRSRPGAFGPMTLSQAQAVTQESLESLPQVRFTTTA